MCASYEVVFYADHDGLGLPSNRWSGEKFLAKLGKNIRPPTWFFCNTPLENNARPLENIAGPLERIAAAKNVFSAAIFSSGLAEKRSGWPYFHPHLSCHVTAVTPSYLWVERPIPWESAWKAGSDEANIG